MATVWTPAHYLLGCSPHLQLSAIGQIKSCTIKSHLIISCESHKYIASDQIGVA